MYSLEEFSINITHDSNGKYHQGFETRQRYSLPNTPKIIILPCRMKNKNGCMKKKVILGEQPPYEFEKLLNYHMDAETVP